MPLRRSDRRTNKRVLPLASSAVLAASLGACGGFSNAELLPARQAESAAIARTVVAAHRAQAGSSTPCPADLQRYRDELATLLDRLRVMGSQLDACFDATTHGASASFTELSRELEDELARHTSIACSSADPEWERMQHTAVMSELLESEGAAAQRIAYMTGRLAMTPRCEEVVLAAGATTNSP